MPYTPNQIRCLSSMGIVPWVERAPKRLHTNVELDVDAELDVDNVSVSTSTHLVATFVEPERIASPIDLMHTPLVSIPFRGQYCTQLGKADAHLLILVEAISSSQNQYPFEPTDAKLFDDMLRGIAWRRQDVCLAVLPNLLQPDLAHQELSEREPALCVADLCKPHRDAVLLFKQNVPETLNTDELLVPMERASMRAWQLPHPALLRESPTRKRQAWNVLKAARACL